jgi:hypothetical protein
MDKPLGNQYKLRSTVLNSESWIFGIPKLNLLEKCEKIFNISNRMKVSMFFQ